MNKPSQPPSSLGAEEQNLLQHVTDRRRQELEIRGGGPSQIAHALREVIARRKIGRLLESRELSHLWASIAPPDIVSKTRIVSLRNRILLVEVADSVLMSELANFHQRTLVKKLQQARADLNIRNLKFRLNAGLNRKVE